MPMMPKHGYNYRLKISLERALDILGDSSKQILLLHLTHRGISFEKECSISDIEAALKGILGSGSALITERMYRDLQQSVPE
jgi:hypothetical protein